MYQWLYSDILCVCAQSLSCVQLGDPMECGSPGSSVHGIFQTRIIQWVAICYSRRISPNPRDQTQSLASSALEAGFLTTVPPGKPPFRYITILSPYQWILKTNNRKSFIRLLHYPIHVWDCTRNTVFFFPYNFIQVYWAVPHIHIGL